MSIWPSHYLPTSGGEDFTPFPQTMQLPIGVDREISASQSFYDFAASAPGMAEAVASAIEQSYAGAIHNFVDTNRRGVGAGSVAVHSRHLELPGMTLRYDNQFGRERLKIMVAPEAENAPGGLQLDLNVDGYVAFMLYDPRFPNLVNNVAGFPKAYDIYMNGYLLKRDFKIVGPCQTFVAMFGQTSLRCQSLVDKQHLNPFENENPPGLAKPVVPPRAKINGDDDVLAYILFDFTTTNNPVYNEHTLNLLGGTETIKTNITGAIQFATATKSPLNTTKGAINYFGVTVANSAGQQGTEDSIGYFIFAEFYSRDKVRPVTQSWSKTATPGGVVLVNDKPLFWGNVNITSYTSLTPGENGMGFNLFEKPGDDDATGPVASLKDPATNAAAFTKSIDAQDDDALLTYYQTVQQIITDFDKTQTPLVKAAIAKVDDAQTTFNADELQLKKDRETVSLLKEELQTYDDLIAMGGDPLLYAIIIANTEAAIPPAEHKVQDDLTKTDDDLIKLNQANVELGNIVGQSPHLPDKPVLNGDDINKFRYREVVVQGDDFIFGGWQGG